MTKMVLTFEADSWGEMAQVLRDCAMRFAMSEPAPPTTTMAEVFKEEEARLAAEAAAAPAPAPAKAVKAATKKRPESVAQPPAPEPEPEEVVASAMPTLDELKQAVTVAVRTANKNGGNRKILDLLPGFKNATGLDFVYNATDEHRGALFDLTRAAGIKVGELAAV